MNKLLIYGIAILAAFLSTVASAGTDTKPNCIHQKKYADSEIRIGYCHAVRFGDTLYISGTAMDGAMPDAIRATYLNLKQTLADNGLTFDNVVRERVYTTDLNTFIRYKNIRRQFYSKDMLPASTWVQVQRLYEPSLVVEVELEARYPK